MFRQRVQLDLIDCDQKGPQFQQVTAVQGEVDYLLLIADHDPDSTVLREELIKVTQMSSLTFTVKVGYGSPMGFGLFAQNILDIATAISLLKVP